VNTGREDDWHPDAVIGPVVGDNGSGFLETQLIF
jgi:hypothetical protein